MDRRQKKTREAIFTNFIALLSEKPYHAITVGEIIGRANVGRATFYAHFETKDFLLKELCEELFGHIADTATGEGNGCDIAEASVFLHLLNHLVTNDRHTLVLLSSQNNEIFRQYFKDGLKKLVQSQLHVADLGKGQQADGEYLINHIAASFVETVDWWLRRGRKESPSELIAYFEGTVGPFLKSPLYGKAPL